MPLHKTIHFSKTTKILIWKITESFEDLFDEVKLTQSSLERLKSMKSEMQQRAFLSVRELLQVCGYTDFELFYDEFGKPFLKDGKHISITHSFEFSSIIISEVTIGIDIEMQREKITLIADKFVNHEAGYLNKADPDYIRKLTVIWGAKEAVFKIRNEKGISFKDHIDVNAFEIARAKCDATLHFGDIQTHFDVYFTEVENFMLVYAFENN